MTVDNLQFYLKINSFGNATILFWCTPKEHLDILLYYQDVCRNLNEFNEILINIEEQRKLSKPTKNLGRNDSSLIVYGDICKLDCEFISGLIPLEISTDDIVIFFTKFREFFNQYQEAQIPGVIPESKLDSWVSVPKEYVKMEWWQLNKREDRSEE